MPKTLADQKIRLTFLTVKPADPRSPTVAELTAGVDLSCSIMKSDFQLGATGDETISEATLCEPGQGNDMGATTFAGTMTVFRMLDDSGKAVLEEDVAYAALKAKGTKGWIVEREGPQYDVPWTAGDEVEVYEVTTGSVQKPSDRSAGYIKRTIPLGVQNAWTDASVAAA